MTGRSSIGRSAKSDTARVLKVAPVTRAIRQVLAVSTAAFALAGSGSAFAAITCSPATNPCTDVVSTGDVSIVNSDVLQGGAVGLHGQTTGTATSVTVTNQAAGEVHSHVLAGNNVSAYGIKAEAASGAVQVNNAGLVDTKNENATTSAFGIAANGADAEVANTGKVQVAGTALAEGVVLRGRISTASNSGEITASASTGWAMGIDVIGQDEASVSNSGTVTATSANGGADGIRLGGATLGEATNTGEIIVQGDDFARGLIINGSYVASVDNSGSVSATSNLFALGVQASSYDGEVSIANSGSIVASGLAEATGVSAFGSSVAITNGGDVLVEAAQPDSEDPGEAIGIRAYAGFSGRTLAETASYGELLIENSGSISANTAKGWATGILAESNVIGIVNSGDIFAHGTYSAVGARVHAIDEATISTSGSIIATTDAGWSAGVLIRGRGGDATLDNSGSITAKGAYVQGVTVESDGIINIINSGDILAEQDATSDYSYVTGIRAMGARVAERSPDADALAVAPGDITIDNSGNITARGTQAIGIEAANTGVITITNGDTGVIKAQSIEEDAIGIRTETYAGAIIDNSGILQVSGHFSAQGIMAFAGYGDSSVTNSGDIGVLADGSASAVSVESYLGNVSLNNAGTVDVQAGEGQARGLMAITRGELASVTNAGNINVETTDGDLAFGIGAAGSNVAIAHSGDLTVKAGGAGSFAAGLIMESDGSADLTIASTGSVDVWAASEAMGALVTTIAEEAVVVNNAGDIHAATGDGLAVGLFVPNHAGFTLTNSGSISADALEGGSAFGVFGPVDGDARIDNSGDIVAKATNGAIAVALNTDGAVSVEVNNTGTIRAESENYVAVAISNFQGDSIVQIANQGDIFGAIVTGYADDTLVNGNGGLWQVVGAGTDFSAGDDSITNAAGGTIHLVNGTISLGSSSAAGNAFTNQGTLRVTGESLIDMGIGADEAPTFGAATLAQVVPAAVPSLNPLALVNNGTIDMMDGVAGDVLTINGDLSGTGAINMDVSLVNGSNDLLVVDGSVAAGSVQTVNVQVDRTPDPEMMPVGIIRVTGDSTVNSFVAGEVTGFSASNFLDVDVAISSTIHADNESDDIFSFGVTVSGLNDGGLLAASIASGAHSLFNSQIGTWHQRMGVYPSKVDGDVGISPWVRVFSDGGEFEAAHNNQQFGGGVLGYDQSNRGSELGLNVNIRDGLNVGLLLADSDATQRLTAGRAGSNRIDAQTVGLYGTWVSSKGFYVDLSHRWMGFDADVRSVAGIQSTSGDAAAWNVEAGYTAWTLPGGVGVTPQLQYTRSEVTNVDALYGDSAAFVGQGGVSKRGRAGVAFSRAFEGAGLQWTPYGSVNAVREFDGKTRYAVNDTYFGEIESEGTSTLVELGLGLQKNSLSVTGGAHWNDGGSLQNFVGGQLVLRYTW